MFTDPTWRETCGMGLAGFAKCGISQRIIDMLIEAGCDPNQTSSDDPNSPDGDGKSISELMAEHPRAAEGIAGVAEIYQRFMAKSARAQGFEGLRGPQKTAAILKDCPESLQLAVARWSQKMAASKQKRRDHQK